jgi:hypothetical protein
VVIPAAAQAFPEFYSRAEVWSAESLARFELLSPRIQAWRSGASPA